MEPTERSISPGSELDMDTATAIYEKLLGAVTQGETLAVDLAEVTAFDTAGVQLLVALVKAAEGVGGTVVFTNPTEDLNRAVRNMGLVKYLGEWPGMAPVDSVSA